MKILVINPNTSETMTRTIGACAQAVAAPGTQIIARCPANGPASIEGHYDEAVGAVGMLEVLRQSAGEGIDATIIACFGDPGLLAAREIARGPVLGVAEAAMRAASFVATGFSVVTTMKRTCIIAEHLVDAYGVRPYCRGVRGTDVPVLALEEPGSDAYTRILAECRAALTQDGSGAIVLGCAGMTSLCERLTQALGAPVIDGVTAAVKFAEALVALKLSTSKAGDLAYPLPKEYRGAFAHLAP
jgi:allantoin racemase